MTTTLIFALTLLTAVYVSCYTRRTILSMAVLFLGVGFFSGEGVFGWIRLEKGMPIVRVFSELALFSVLFNDGLEVDVKRLVSSWRLPGRALAFGLPLTLAGTGFFAHVIVGLPWLESFLLGAALSPTDPVLVSAIVGRQNVPMRLRDLLNIESGFNDGLALPFVVVLLALSGGTPPHYVVLLEEIVLGIVIGVAVSWVAVKIERAAFLSATPFYMRFLPLAVAILVYALADLTHSNKFLAAFSAGIAIAALSDEFRMAFEEFGENVTELLKLAALLLFGALASIQFVQQTAYWQGYVFMAVSLLLVRPAALSVSLLGTGMRGRQLAAALWFGPKGFASVVYSLLILNSDVPNSWQIFHLAALVIAASIVLHSSTDVPISKWLEKEGEGA